MPDTDTIIMPIPFYLRDTADVTAAGQEVNVGITWDSIFPVCEQAEPLLHKSLFTHHGMPVKYGTLKERTDVVAPAWFFLLLLVLTVLVFLYHHARKIKFSELLKSTIDRRVMDRMVRECNLIRSAQFVPVALLLSATLGMALYTVAMQKTGFGGYMLLSIAIATGYLLRNGLLRLIGNVFENRDAITAYITSNYLYHLVLTTFTVPLLFLQVYSSWGQDAAIYVILGLVAFTFVVRFIRGINLFLTLSKSFRFYLFYYLCTVEIIPILVLLKIIIE